MSQITQLGIASRKHFTKLAASNLTKSSLQREVMCLLTHMMEGTYDMAGVRGGWEGVLVQLGSHLST